MLLNHISNIFMNRGTFLSEFFLDIGYFTAISMCYFLVEGYQYTRSKKKYALRLAAFAIISQVPFSLAFTKDGIIRFKGLNMLFSLLICFLIIICIDKIKRKFLKNSCNYWINDPIFDLRLAFISSGLYFNVCLGKRFEKTDEDYIFYFMYFVRPVLLCKRINNFSERKELYYFIRCHGRNSSLRYCNHLSV